MKQGVARTVGIFCLGVIFIAFGAVTPASAQQTATDPAVLSIIYSGNFPTPQPLSVVLVPPPSPYAAIGSANFPAPQPLSVVLVPPPSPYGAIGTATFPVPQPLSVVLDPGVAQAALPVAVASTTIVATAAAAGTGTPPSVYGLVGTAQGTVTLTRAPDAPLLVPLRTNNTAATVPENVTVPAGQTNATFPIQTSMVGEDVNVAISAGEGTVARAAVLAVRAWPALLSSIDAPTIITSGTELSASVICSCSNYPIPFSGSSGSIAISSSNPAVLTVTGGALSSAQNLSPITIKTEPVATATSVVITASFGGQVVTRNVSVEPPVPAEVASVTMASVYEGITGPGTVALDKPAGKGGERVQLASSSAVITVQGEVTVPEGQTTALFTARGDAVGTATITAKRGSDGVERQTVAEVLRNEVKSLELSPTEVTEGGSATATITLDAPARSGGISITVGGLGIVGVPKEITIPPAATTATFTVTPIIGAGLGRTRTLNARRSDGPIGSTAGMRMEQLTILGPGAQLDKVDLLTTSSVPSGSKVLFSADLSGAAPAGGVEVTLDHGSGTGPTIVTVPAGASSQNFETIAPAVAAVTTLVVSATYGGVTRTNQVEVWPAELASVSVSPNSIAHGMVVTGTAQLSGTAPPGGVQVSLDHGGGSGAAFVTVPAGQSNATFQTSPPAVSSAMMLTVAATYQGVTRNASLSVIPAAGEVSSLTIVPTAAGAGTTPAAVYGGPGIAQGTVTLARAATTQAGVPLRSNNSAAVVPAIATVQAGQTSATFLIQTALPPSDTAAAISAGEGTLARAAVLLVKAWPPLLRSIDAPTSIVGGTELSASVLCDCETYPIVLFGSAISMSSSNPAVLKITGGSLTEGQNVVPITMKTEPVVTRTTVTITASFGSGVITKNVAVEPAAPTQTTAPVVARAPTEFLVQIVQVIPRRGVNFFDRTDPAGDATVVVAQAGGGGVAGGGGAGACAAGPTAGGTFQSVTADVNFECHALGVVSGPGDVLAMGDLHVDFVPPGANLSAVININGDVFAILTGANKSTFSITGVTNALQGTVPAGTPMRIDGTATNLGKLDNFTLTVCPAAGTVVYRRPAGDCI